MRAAVIFLVFTGLVAAQVEDEGVREPEQKLIEEARLLLANDGAVPRDWAKAASSLIDWRMLRPVEGIPEPVDPSIGELMGKRAMAILNDRENLGDNRFGNSLALVQALWCWDRAAGEQLIGELAGVVPELYESHQGAILFVERFPDFFDRTLPASDSSFRIFQFLAEANNPAQTGDMMFMGHCMRTLATERHH